MNKLKLQEVTMKTSLDIAYLVKQAKQTTLCARIDYNESIRPTLSAHDRVQSSVPRPIQAPGTAIIVIGQQTINYNPNPTL